MNVTIIIPIYNVASYICQCIESVLAQTMLMGVECILVDDCGTDDSVQIATDVLKNNGFRYHEGDFFDHQNFSISFRIIHHHRNRGLSAARNTGIKAATGDYLFFMDSDDWIVPECLELMMQCVQKNPESQMVFAGADVLPSGHRYLDYTKKNLPEFSDDRDWLQLAVLKRYALGMTAWNKLISKKFLIENRLFFIEGLYHEDEIWNFMLSKHIKCASFLSQNTYVYNIRPNSITTGVTKEQYLQRFLKIWKAEIEEVGGYRKRLQIKAICSQIIEKTRLDFPHKERYSIGLLYLRLAFIDHGTLFFPLLVQSLLSMVGWSSMYVKHAFRAPIRL